MKPTEEQAEAIDTVVEWFKSSSPREKYMSLGGYAGTGKTTLLSWIPDALGLDSASISHIAYTGKACNVMRRKGIVANTIHSFLYDVDLDIKTGTFYFHLKNEPVEERLIVVDEASMVPEDLFNDLMRIGGDFKVLFVGDHGQLPPIGNSMNLMKKPIIRLEKIMRQAEHNPIIRLSQRVREGDFKLKGEEFTDDGLGFSSKMGDLYDEDLGSACEHIFRNEVFICSTNKLRVEMNEFARDALWGEQKEDTLVNGERVIFLENNREQKLFNGMMGTVSDFRRESKHNYEILMAPEGERRRELTFKEMDELVASGAMEEAKAKALIKKVNRYAINDPKPESSFKMATNKKMPVDLMGTNCSYGYGITCHKAQGSQFRVVFLKLAGFEARMWGDDYSRWLYTAITRAEKRLHVML